MNPFQLGGRMRTHKLSISIVLLSALLAIFVACSNKHGDDAIAKDIQDKVAADPDTKDSSVSVAAREGKITLTGKVKTPAAQQKVEQIAKAEPGATAVDDQTMVDTSAAPAEAMAPPPPAPAPEPIVVPAGTMLTVKTQQALGSKTSKEGQTFLATVAQPIGVNGQKAIPAGATASGTVVSAKAKGKIKGQGELSLALTSISIKGHTYEIQTDPVDQVIKGKGKRTAVATGGGAAGGALIGGIAGGGKGAGIGALVGAGAGLIGGAATGNQQIEIPAESALTFRLSAPLTLPPPAQ
jgi:hypothetical protein